MKAAWAILIITAVSGLAAASSHVAAVPAIAEAGCDSLPDRAGAMGKPLELGPAGQCLVKAAGRGNGLAALRLGDFYRDHAEAAAGLDTFGREVEWYRRALALGVPQANVRLMQVLDRDLERQMPDRALAHGIRAVQLGSRDAADTIGAAYEAGRIAPGKLYYLRQWLGEQGPRLDHEAGQLLSRLDRPAAPLVRE